MQALTAHEVEVISLHTPLGRLDDAFGTATYAVVNCIADHSREASGSSDYCSIKQVLVHLTSYTTNCRAIYFDDTNFNFSSRFTGEMRAVAEIKAAGSATEFVPDRTLTWNSNRIYRFVNLNAWTKHPLKEQPAGDPVRYRRDDSPFP